MHLLYENSVALGGEEEIIGDFDMKEYLETFNFSFIHWQTGEEAKEIILKERSALTVNSV